MAMNVGNAGGGVMCDINTTPLIDVMLVLLVTLIVSLPIMTHAVKLDMPQNNNPAAAGSASRGDRPRDRFRWHGRVERHGGAEPESARRLLQRGSQEGRATGDPPAARPRAKYDYVRRCWPRRSATA